MGGHLTGTSMEAIMGFLDKFKDKAADAVGKHGDKISGGLDKAGEFADKKTKGKYTDKIAMGKGKIGEGMSKLDKTPDITSSRTTSSPGVPMNPAAGAGEPFNPAAGTTTPSPSAPQQSAQQPMGPTSVPGSDSAAPMSSPRPAYEPDPVDDSTLPPSAPPYPPAP